MGRWFGALLLILALAPTPGRGAPAGAGPADAGEVRFTVGERAVLTCLRAATPLTFTVGTSLLSADLILLDPSDVVLARGRASFRIRVKGRTLPVDQVITPIITIQHDPRTGQFYGVVSSLPLSLPGVGTIDLRDYLPRLEIPAILENLWNVGDRPLGVRLRIRRIAILDHLLEVGADVDIAPMVSSREPGAP